MNFADLYYSIICISANVSLSRSLTFTNTVTRRYLANIYFTVTLILLLLSEVCTLYNDTTGSLTHQCTCAWPNEWQCRLTLSITSNHLIHALNHHLDCTLYKFI